MTIDLDTRARAAAEGVRRSAAGLEVPPWKDDRRRLVGGRSAWWLAAAALVVVAAVAALLARDDSEPVATGGGETPLLVPDVLPEGFDPMEVLGLPLEAVSDRSYTTSVFVYGSEDDTNPFTGADLGIFVARPERISPLEADGGITVRGHEGWATTDSAGRDGVTWLESDGIQVTLSSASLGQAGLVAVAEGLSFNDDYRQVDASGLPAGLVPVATMLDATDSGFGIPISQLPGTAAGHVLRFQSGYHLVTVTALSGGRAELLVLRWLLGGSALEQVQVRGHAGFLSPREASSAGGDSVGTVLWEESPGVLVIVAGDVDDEALLATAESLREGTPSERASFTPTDLSRGTEESPTTTLGEQPATLAEGTASDGSTWRLTTGGNLESGPNLCFEIESESSGSGSCGTFGGGPGLHEDEGFPHFVFGQVPPPGTTVVRVILVGGADVAAPMVNDTYYVIELPEGTEPAEVLFVDAEGNEVGRSPLNE